MRNLKSILLTGGFTAAAAIVCLTGCSTFEHHEGDRTAGRYLDDKTLSAKVEGALKAEPVYKFGDVDVKTYNGVVQLSGFVTSDQQKSRAGEIAQRVDGVSQVINNIALKNVPTPTGRVDVNGNLNTNPSYNRNPNNNNIRNP